MATVKACGQCWPFCSLFPWVSCFVAFMTVAKEFYDCFKSLRLILVVLRLFPMGFMFCAICGYGEQVSWLL